MFGDQRPNLSGELGISHTSIQPTCRLVQVGVPPSACSKTSTREAAVAQVKNASVDFLVIA